MAAQEHLNKTLFHGTAGEIHGGIVNPSARGRRGPGAYATNSLSEAESYAAARAHEEGRLFGTVYEVEPLSDDHQTYNETETWGEFHNSHPGVPDIKYTVDQKGLKVKGVVSYPANTWAVYHPPPPSKEDDWGDGPVLG